MSFLQRLFRSNQDKPDTGRAGEQIAAEYLRDHGYQVLERNWRCSLGEIDLICRSGGEIIFVEVKSSLRRGVLPPEMRVNSRKRGKLLRLAEVYLKSRRLSEPVRLDVISVWWSNGKPECEHFVNAISG